MSREYLSALFLSAVLAAASSQSHGAQAEWEPTGGPGGGHALAFGKAGEVMFASSLRGVARSTDGGASWSIVSGLGTNAPVNAFATIGTRILAGDADGVVHASDDLGATWFVAGSPDPGASVLEMVVDDQRVFLVTVSNASVDEGRLWRSDDAGLSWSEIELPVQQGVRFGASAVFARGSLLLVGSAQPGSGGIFGVILRSEDAGESWDIITQGIPAFNLGLRHIIARDDVVFVGTGVAGVLRSHDLGRTWEQTEGAGGPPGEPTVLDMAATDESIFFVGIKPDNGQEDIGLGLWRSDDLGQTWERRDAGLHLEATAGVELWSTASTLFVGSRFASIWTSPDEGLTWSKVVDGFAFADVLALASRGRTLLATPAGTSEIWTSDAGSPWTLDRTLSVPGEAFGQVLEIFTAQDLILAGTQGEGIYRSTDGGTTYAPANDGIPTYIGTAGVQYREIEAFTGDDGTIFAGTGIGIQMIDGVFMVTGGGALRSDDGGGSWRSINAGLPIIARDQFNQPVYDPILTIHQASSGTLLAGHFLGSGIFRSTDGGESWQASNTGLPSNPRIRDIIDFEGSLFATGDLGNPPVWRSDDDGLTWFPASSGLPLQHEGAALLSAGGRIFAAIETGTPGDGVFVSEDGFTWSRAGSQLDGVPVRRLAALDHGVVVAGTVGLSVWQMGDACPSDINGDGTVDTQDFFAFLDLFASGDSGADFDADGVIDAEDFFAFLDAFALGC